MRQAATAAQAARQIAKQPTAPPDASDLTARLETLAEWLKKGIITQEDFDAKKNQIINAL
jgi:predicted Zn-dependent peptidase